MKAKFNTQDITIIKTSMIVFKDYYWMCENGDITKALFYGTSPQCNTKKSIVEHLMKDGAYQNLSAQIVFVPIAYVPQPNMQ